MGHEDAWPGKTLLECSLFDTVIDLVADGVIIAEATDGRVQKVSPSISRLAGFAPEEFVGAVAADWLARLDMRPVDGSRRYVVEEMPLVRALRGETVRDLEVTLVKPDGERSRLLCNAAPIRDAEGAVAYGVFSWRDITRLKQTEERLRRREQEYRALVEHSPDIIGRFDRRLHRIYINPAVETVTGIPRDELLNRHAREATFFTPAAAKAFAAAMERVFATGEDDTFEGEISTDGGGKFLHVRLVPETGPDGVVETVLAVSRDITGRVMAERELLLSREEQAAERERAEAALTEREGLFGKVLETLPIGVWIIGQDGRILMGNDAGRRIWGGARYVGMEEYGEYKAWRLETSERVQAEDWSAARAITRGEATLNELLEIETFDRERKIIKASAVPIIDGQGRITGAIAVNEDITAWWHAEEELHRREQEYKALVENSPEVIARYDRSLRQIYINPAIEEIAGQPPEALIGKLLPEIDMPEGFKKALMAGIVKVLDTGREDTFEASLDTMKGVRHYQLRVVPEFSRAGRVESVLNISQDITHLKRLEAELTKARDAAEKASRAKSEFLAAMSHEIRTPLNGIIGMTDLALSSCGRERCGNFVRLAGKSARNLLVIINDILDLSKIEAGRFDLEKEPFGLRAMLEELFLSLKLEAERKGLVLAWHIHPAVPERLLGDEGRLRQIYMNLIGNAIKFTQAGRIDISIEAVEGAAGLCSMPGPASGRICLVSSVRDTGSGIPRDKADKIFEAFESSGPISGYGGTGLGLSISRRLAELMGGTIWFESEPGAGSVFSFSVVLETTAEEVAAKPVEGRKIRHGQLRILVAEDNPINRILAEGLLEARGHRVRSVENGRDAIEALRHETFDLVLMDVMMPEMGGEEATRAIREHAPPGVDPRIPIVALTAHALKGDRERFLAAGMDDYLAKPIDQDQLDDVLDRIAGRSATGADRTH